MDAEWTELTTCRTPGCHRLIEDAVPLPGKSHGRLSPVKAQKHCSLSCARRDLTQRLTCQSEDCSKLIRNAVPSITSDLVSTPDFDTKRFCSGVCAGHICCTICATFKPLAQYIHIVNGRLNIQVPVHCYWHISPTGRDFNGEAVCIECIKAYITIRFRERGLEGLNCIIRGCNHRSGFSGRDWREVALGYLPPELHAQFFEQSIRSFMSKEQTWTCPNGCDTSGVTVQPNATPGYPHVECTSCSGRFCAGCKVAWHKDQTCQQYQLEHPTALTDDERTVIENLAKLGARRCPVCQFIIIKEGGCSHINCEQCRHDFDWRKAEKVRPLQLVECGDGVQSEEVEGDRELPVEDDGFGDYDDYCYAEEDDEELAPVRQICEMDRLALEHAARLSNV